MLLPVPTDTASPVGCPIWPALPIFRRRSSRDSFAGGLRGIAEKKCLNIPQRVWLKDRRLKIPDFIPDADQDVRRGKENEWLIFVKNLLHTVVAFLSFCKAICDELPLHQFVYFCFPGRRRMSLRRIPEMCPAA